MKLELSHEQIGLIIESLQDRPDYSERDDVRFLDAYIQEEEWIDEQDESDGIPKPGDIVRVLDQPKHGLNRYARVEVVNEADKLVRISNLNQPFQGTFASVYRRFEDVEVVEGFGE